MNLATRTDHAERAIAAAIPAPHLAPVGCSAVEWRLWSTTARLVVTDPGGLDAAHRLVADHLALVEEAASRFRPDSEITQVNAAAGTPRLLSPLLARYLGVALDAAESTEGAVDPTIGRGLLALGYDRDVDLLPRTGTVGAFSRIVVTPPTGWRRVHLSGRVLRMPAGTLLDLGASAKALAADDCAALVARSLGTGVLVSLGGDIATAGPAPRNGWQVLVQDIEDDPACQVGLPAGAAIATSSTVRRQWRHGDRLVHHILDPATGQPCEPVWRSVTVAAGSCVEANTLTTAAHVRGAAALGWLRRLGSPARLVSASGVVICTRTWPQRPDREEVPGWHRPGGSSPDLDTT